MENIVSTFTKQDATNEPGVYLVVHEKSNKFYVGSTNNLRTRRNGHITTLFKGKNHNVALQDLYKEDQKIKFLYEPTATREDAYTREQELLNKFGDSEQMLNIAKNAKAAGLGVKRSKETCELISQVQIGRVSPKRGTKMSEEQREKIVLSREPLSKKVSVDSKEYVSLAEASRQLGLTIGCLYKRIHSNNPAFNNYNYI